jgi:hypothetical protein
MRKSILLSALTLVLVSSLIALAYATDWIPSQSPAGAISPGTEVTLTGNVPAEYTVSQVQFLWFKPTDYVNPVKDETDNSAPFESKNVLNDEGTWKVRLIYTVEDGPDPVEEVTVMVRIRSVIPELPLIGTAGASIAMLLGFTYKIKRKTKK